MAAASSLSRRNASTARAENLMVQVHVERTIAASPERVLDWLVDPANLTVAPVFLKAGWAKGFVGSRRGSAAGSDRNRLLGARTDHGLRTRPGATPISPSARSRPRNTRAVR